MEALRIFAMSMILIWHFLIHGMTSEVFAEKGIEYIYHIVKCFVYSGVNLFFLISGYFTIRYSFDKLVVFILNIVVFGFINLTLIILSKGEVTLFSAVNILVYPVSGSPYWFMKIYMLLMITAPILNAGLRSILLKQLRNTLILLIIILGYMRGKYASYNYLNAVLFYCIGYYFRNVDVAAKFSKISLIVIFLMSCSLCAVMVRYIDPNVPILRDEFFDYENIFAVTSAVAIFLLFSKLRIRSKLINSIAGASLGCYLLQDGQFGKTVFYAWQVDYFKVHGVSLSTLMMFTITFLAVWLAAIAVTNINKLWLNRFGKTLAVHVKSLIRQCVAFCR